MAQFDMPIEQLRQYRTSASEPRDFDEFWDRTLTAARRFDIDARLEPVDCGLSEITVDDVTFAGFGGHPIKAWLMRPAHRTGDLPVVVEYMAYGGGRGLPHERLAFAAAGWAHLVMDVRGQGSGWGSGGETPDPVGSGPSARGFLTRGILDQRDSYYRRLITDGVRAVDAVARIDGLDTGRIAVMGTSQGGGIAIAVAGLSDAVDVALPNVPFLCDFRRATDVTDVHPYGEITEYLAVHRGHEEMVFTTLAYVDGVNFARRAKAAALFSVGLMDAVCPPSTVFAAYNEWGRFAETSPARDISVYPYNRHEGGHEYQFGHALDWLRLHLGVESPANVGLAGVQ